MSVEGGKAKQGPTLGVHFTGVSSKREPTVLYYPFTEKYLPKVGGPVVKTEFRQC